MSVFKNSNRLIYKIIGRFVVWETPYNGYYVTDKKQRFVLCYGTLEECLYFVDVRPYGMTLEEMENNNIEIL